MRLSFLTLFCVFLIGCTASCNQNTTRNTEQQTVQINTVDEIEICYFQDPERGFFRINKWNLFRACRNLFPPWDSLVTSKGRYVLIDRNWLHEEYLPYYLKRYADVIHGTSYDTEVAATHLRCDIYRLHSQSHNLEEAIDGVMIGKVFFKNERTHFNGLLAVVFLEPIVEPEDTNENEDIHSDDTEIETEEEATLLTRLELLNTNYYGLRISSVANYTLGIYFIDPVTGDVVNATDDLLQNIWYIYF